MSSGIHKECQECKKVFLIPLCSRSMNEHSCPFCGSWNTAYISQLQYHVGYRKVMIPEKSKYDNLINERK